MKKLFSVLSSTWLMAILLFVFFISITSATFIEHLYGTDFARAMIYNAGWFNLLFLLIAINLLSVIVKNRLYQKEKIPQFVFHVAFIFIIMGAGITRFFSYEGTMKIREGNDSDSFVSNNDYIHISVFNNKKNYTFHKPLRLSTIFSKRKSYRLKLNQSVLGLKILQYYSHAIKSAIPERGGFPVAEFIAAGQEGRKKFQLKEGEKIMIDSLLLSFNANDSKKADIEIYNINNELFFNSCVPVNYTGMTDQISKQLNANQLHKILPRVLYDFNGVTIVLLNFLPEAKFEAIPVANDIDANAGEAIKIRIKSDKKTTEYWLWKTAEDAENEKIVIDSNEIYISYSPLNVKLPFTIYLSDFILERYPGSNSPSWFESRIILKDSISRIEKPKRIFMNNVLKYKGFRFYQTSFDTDEKGTVLTVTHDFAGMVITYTGYFLMAIGMILTLFNKNSRFSKLQNEINKINKKKKMLLTGVISFLFLLPGISQNGNRLTVSASHAKEFGKLLIQDYDGRIKPINTLNVEIIRKLYRKDQYQGLSADQFILSMLIDPENWQKEPFIRCRHPEIKKILKSQQSYYSFSSFFINQHYVLIPYVENAYRKRPVNRNKLDNEIIKINEKVGIAYMIFSNDMLRIFPRPHDSTNTWYAPANASEQITYNDSLFVSNIFQSYLNACKQSCLSDNWEEPEKLLTIIKSFQRKHGESIIPPENRIKAEILLNKTNPFDRISDYYGVIGLLILCYQFIGLFYQRVIKRVPIVLANFFIIALFLIHTAGMVLRWYVSGHAPWSNGYETLIYIAWATVLAGIIFSRKVPITLSITSVMSFLILKMAHLSSMDPQITNLAPVLKSYWLVIHVATITASYGFLGLAALVALINLLLMIFHNKNNFYYIDLSIRELTHIIELTLIIGLFLLTTGTFLGAVWANESWGRYWGWDPKETWALATIILYVFVTHMRIIPGLNKIYGFNLMAFLSFGSVIMTYFGVNYFLSGLHSYAKSDPIFIPVYIYFTLFIFALILFIAFIKRKLLYSNQTK